MNTSVFTCCFIYIFIYKYINVYIFLYTHTHIHLNLHSRICSLILEGETSISCLLYAPWLGIKPANFSCTKGHSNQQSEPPSQGPAVWFTYSVPKPHTRNVGRPWYSWSLYLSPGKGMEPEWEGNFWEDELSLEPSTGTASPHTDFHLETTAWRKHFSTRENWPLRTAPCSFCLQLVG